ncbi:F-box protein [Prunus yedoensis var. nudiflora]|uniref:F-box protein n=2 Tax=Prunus yedoensis var. nudiflora TaxID=2094558 RepID=A0A314UIA5_PRUYE|nr:F-box protein [Prunus yedoensis var. nudiflora]
MKRIIQCFRHPATNRSRPPKQEDDDEEEEHDQKPYILQLPDHIILEIFCKIPTKTLIQCKRVCKSWRCCLSDPQFTRELFSRTSACLLVTGVRWHWGHFLVDLDGTWNPNVVALKLFSKISLQTTMVGSCNGFLCHYSRCHLHISNPVTGELLSLPTPSELGTLGDCYGFGFSPISGVCKLVRITSREGEPKQVMVLTVGSGIWRNIGHPAYSFSSITPCHGIYLNGFLHWIGRSCRDWSRRLCAFDVESERFQELPLPPSSYDLDKTYFKLGVLKGWLSVILNLNGDISVWVMKDYGVKESWTKEHEFKDPVGSFGTSILKFTEEGQVLGLNNDDRSMQAYTLARTGLVRVEVDGLPLMISEAWDLVPSFFSLKDISP